MKSQENHSPLFNVPNQLTAIRLVLAILLFVLAAQQRHGWALAVFLVAASTDWLDGYWARKFQQVTQVGRIFDPFVDKIIVCGAFIFLAAEQDQGSGIAPWMAVVVVGRELLVTALRGLIEQRGGDFSAKMAGKLKMVLQCVAVAASFAVLARGGPKTPPDWLDWTLLVSVWLAVLMTVYSGAGYVVAAKRFLRRSPADA